MDLEKLLDLRALGGELAELYNFVNAGKSCAVVALGASERAHVATHLGRFVLYVVPDSPTQNLMYERISSFCPRTAVLDRKDEAVDHGGHDYALQGVPRCLLSGINAVC